MSNAEYYSNSMTAALQNIRMAEVDWMSKQSATFEAMLKSMLVWKDITTNVLSDEDEERLKDKATIDYNNLLDTAIEFCNLAQRGDPVSQWKKDQQAQKRDANFCRLIKEALHDYCNATTKVGPYAALTTVLNLILAWTVRDEPNNDPDVIFVTNYLPWSGPRYFDDQPNGNLISSAFPSGNIPFDPTRSWCDIDQFVEVEKHLAKLNTDFLNHQYSRQDLTNIVLGSQDTLPPRSNKIPVSQWPRTGAGLVVEPLGWSVNIPPASDIRTAVYAIERLQSSWDFSHAAGIYISGTDMSMRWYDAEGCIESTSINIIQHLPLLVVFLDIMQRSKRLRGYSDAKTNVNGIGRIHTDTEIGPHFESSGRRTYGASFSLKSNIPLPIISDLDTSSGSNTTTIDEAQHFFKVTWPEIRRDKEPCILRVALERAAKYLPVEHQEAVTGHLSNIVRFEEVEGTSTATIRHYLLWLIGIAHGDVSLSSCMVDGSKGVLNHFDFSVIMKLGASSFQTGFNTVGTKPFMALDLLADPSCVGVFPRLYHHELESFSWVLLWAGLCAQMIGPPFDEWLTQDHLHVYNQKVAFRTTFPIFCSADRTSLYDATASALKGWLTLWANTHGAFLDRWTQGARGALSGELRGCELIAQMIKVMNTNELHLPIGDSWLSVQVMNVD